jgi:hypothetical protein
MLTDTCSQGNNLIVPVCTVRERCDKTCILTKDDHPNFISRQSYVRYAGLIIIDTECLKQKVDDGRIQYRGFLPPDAFKRVSAGVLASHHVSVTMRRYYLSQSKENSQAVRGSARG